MFCQECGAQIRAHAKFCNRCGSEVRQRFGDIDNDPTVALPPPPPLLTPPVSTAPGTPPPRPPQPVAPPPSPHQPVVSPPSPPQPVVPPPHSAPGPADRQPLSKHAWPRAEEAIVMPAIEKQPTQAAPPPPRTVLSTETPGNMRVRFDLMKPDTSDVEHAPSTGQINSAPDTQPAVERPPLPQRRNEEMKPFFTQVSDAATPNRQHNRLILVVPLLLLVAALLFVFAYIAAR